MRGEAPCLGAEPEGQTVEHQAEEVPAEPTGDKKDLGLALSACKRLLPRRVRRARRFSQFTVLDEDALRELVSFFEDLLVVDVGHGGDEALEEEQDVTHTQGAQLLHQRVPPGLRGEGGHPRLTGTVWGEKRRAEGAEANNSQLKPGPSLKAPAVPHLLQQLRVEKAGVGGGGEGVRVEPWQSCGVLANP